jgi:hypothetical protein
MKNNIKPPGVRAEHCANILKSVVTLWTQENVTERYQVLDPDVVSRCKEDFRRHQAFPKHSEIVIGSRLKIGPIEKTIPTAHLLEERVHCIDNIM